MSNKNQSFTQSQSDTYTQELQEINNWLYSIHLIDETLDVNLIEGRAKQLLFQSLNNRDLVAFIGSGISMSYGRLSWDGWKERQLNDVTDLASSFIELASATSDLFDCCKEIVELIINEYEAEYTENKSQIKIQVDPDNQIPLVLNFKKTEETLGTHLKLLKGYIETEIRKIEYHKQEIDTLYTSIQGIKTKSKGDANTDLTPIIFQVAEQLHDRIKSSSLNIIDVDNVNNLSGIKSYEESEHPALGKFTPPVAKERLGGFAGVVDAALTKEIKAYLKSITKDDGFPNVVVNLIGRYRESTRNYKISMVKFIRYYCRESTQNTFSDMGKMLLVDEVAHSEAILIEALQYEEKNGRMKWADVPEEYKVVNAIYRNRQQSTKKNNLSRKIKGIRNLPDRYWVLGCLKTESLKIIIETIKTLPGVERWQPILDILDKQISENSNPEKRQSSAVDRMFVSPVHRYVFKALLFLFEHPYKTFCGELATGDENEKDENGSPNRRLSFDLGLKRDDYQARTSLIDESMDPLSKLVFRLGIRQFLTLNYDFEIERLFQDRGYVDFQHQLEGGDRAGAVERGGVNDYRVDGLGGVLKDLTFDRKRANELLTFALDQDDSDATVYHLHGQASEGSEIVVTEKDYKNLYLKKDKYHDLVQNSINLAFSANPLFFAGIGMTEEDILRPLRQFMSDKNRASERSSIAIVAATKSRTERIKNSSILYIRYGVYTMYYGAAKVAFKENNGEVNDVFLDWLHHTMMLRTEISKINSESEEKLLILLGLEKNNANADIYKSPYDMHNIRTRYDSSLEVMGNITCSKHFKKYSALDALFGREISFDDVSRGLLAQLVRPYFVSEYGRQPAVARLEDIPKHDFDPEWDPYLQFELESIAALFTIALKANEEDLGNKELIFQSVCEKHKKADAYSNDEKAFLNAELRSCKALGEMIQEIYGSILTGCFCANLDLIEEEWQNWWENWQISPPNRVAEFHKTTNTDISQYLSVQPRVHVRHKLKDSLLTLSHSTNGKETGLRSYDRFIESVKYRSSYDIENEDLTNGRRIYLICANRGTGRGSFLSALRSTSGLQQYINAVWPTEVVPLKVDELNTCLFHRPIYLDTIFINLSFSTEVSSTYDMTINALEESVAEVHTVRTYIEKYGADFKDKLLEIYTQKYAEETDQASSEITEFTNRIRLKKEQINRELQETSRVDRIFTLFTMLKNENNLIKNIIQFSEEKIQIRVLIVLNSIDILTYSGGAPKNQEIENLMQQLLSIENSDCPFDIVMTTIEDKLSYVISRKTDFSERYSESLKQLQREVLVTDEYPQNQIDLESQINYLTIFPEKNTLRGINAIIEKESNTGITWLNKTKVNESVVIGENEDGEDRYASPGKYTSETNSGESTQLLRGSPSNTCFVHFARTVQPERFLVDNFYCLASILYINFMVNSVLDAVNKEDKAHVLASTEYENIINKKDYTITYQEKDKIWNQTEIREIYKEREKIQIDRDMEISSIVRLVLVQLSELVSKLTLDPLVKEKIEYDLKKISEIPTVPDDVDEEVRLDHIKREKLEISGLLKERYTEGRDLTSVKEWQDIRKVLGNNRYCLTVLLAATSRIALSGPNMLQGAKWAETFIRKCIDRISSVDVNTREESILYDVLDSYETFHRVDHPRYDVNLHIIVLRHLAVCGSPCSVDVMVWMPKIRRYFDDVEDSGQKYRSRTLRLTECLMELADRGLVFVLDPQPRLVRKYEEIEKLDLSADAKLRLRAKYHGAEDPELTYRYSLHRLMQRHIYRKMGAGLKEVTELNSFSPSLYASLPSDLPKLTSDAHQFLHELVNGLSQYPDRKRSHSDSESWHIGRASLSTRIQALRAALSVVRSTFSIGVVSRFQDYQFDEAGDLELSRGYLEDYRIQIRWLIRKAWSLVDKNYTDHPRQSKPDKTKDNEEWPHINAFYRDEIVWLYNECGVVCLLQGNLNDAAALLRQSLKLNRHIEGKSIQGPQYCRISLNLAIVQIERGRLDSAYKMLKIISRRENKGLLLGRVWHIAHGYLGVLHMLNGDLEAAERQLRRAIVMLRAYKDSRACSIFYRHYCYLERNRKRFDKSRELARNAIAFAETGGHEDLHHKARLAELRLDFEESQLEDIRLSQNFMYKIDTIVEYAEYMEMPSLTCDAIHLRAQYLMSQGETLLAGETLTEAMAIAKRNGMRLKLNSLMTDYGRNLINRRLFSQAAALLNESRNMAVKVKNQLEINLVDEVIHLIKR